MSVGQTEVVGVAVVEGRGGREEGERKVVDVHTGDAGYLRS
jgi:hypothetical protein